MNEKTAEGREMSPVKDHRAVDQVHGGIFVLKLEDLSQQLPPPARAHRCPAMTRGRIMILSMRRKKVIAPPPQGKLVRPKWVGWVAQDGPTGPWASFKGTKMVCPGREKKIGGLSL